MSKLLSLYTLGRYDVLPTEEEKQSITSDEETPCARSRSNWAINFWIITTVFFASLSTWLGAELHTRKFTGSFEKGFSTEFEPARHLIQVEQTTFKGSPHFRDDGSEYVPDDGGNEPQYVGEPSRAMDHAWALLHFGRFFLLTEEEAKDSWGGGYREFWSPKDGGYIAGLEVLHTLHCLDHIRKAFYPEHYPKDQAIHGVMHRDHCIDHLRQMVMCNADITPIPSRFYSGIDQNYIDSDRPHTCRNFGKIREWVTERWNGSLAVPPQNPTGPVDDEWKKDFQ
ncbi:MAG: hypothetical protein MMC33_007630 [Icmadophila ericetorum]|nr:hypothetical protein [Icmadophila ericetorum]